MSTCNQSRKSSNLDAGFAQLMAKLMGHSQPQAIKSVIMGHSDTKSIQGLLHVLLSPAFVAPTTSTTSLVAAASWYRMPLENG